MTNDTLQLTHAPLVKTRMLIRKSPHEVFEAFVDPTVTTHFWFTKSSGRLEPQAEVTWEWGMYGVSTTVKVKNFQQDKKLVIEWNEDQPTTVEWNFIAHEGTTFVTIAETGFKGTGDQIAEQAIGSMGGFSFLLAGAKAYLEHGIDLRLTADHAPVGLTDEIK